MNYRKFIPGSLLMVMLAFLVTSCYQQEEINLDELDITLTKYENTFDFQSYQTFAVRDSVEVMSDYWDEDDYENFYESGGAASQIRQYTIQKFQDMGYTLVTEDEDYDFAVNLVLLAVNNVYVVTYPNWWYYYPGYWYGGYWGGYPAYGWAYYDVYTYQTGSLLTEMMDGASVREYLDFVDGKTQEELDDLAPDDFPPVYIRWQSFIQGVVSTSVSYDKDRMKAGIDQAFEQSPYLKKN
jgi:hypothetical protein